MRKVRYLVLRKPLGMTYEETVFEKDDDPNTTHVVAYQNTEPISCLTLMPPE